jgi:zinc/manganese transport system substrate-binding protein
VHPEGNPHYWLDPENGRKMARAIAARLSQLEPRSAPVFARNLAAFEQQLTAKEADWDKRMAPFEGKKIVTFHKSWSYFARRYGLEIIGHVEPKPGIPPSPQHTLELLKQMKAQGVKLLVMENFYDRRVPDLIAQKTGAKVVYVPSMTGGEDGVKTYLDLFEKIVSAFESAGKS